eukprot:jgi/Psemu1/26279/gm1.26279_g
MSEDKDSETDKTEERKKRSNGNKFESSGNTFKGPIPELKDHDVFTYTENIRDKQWLKSREAFISYAGWKYYGKDVRATLTEMEVTIITAKAPAPSHDKETIKAALTPLEAKNWELGIKEYRIAAKELEDNLGVLFNKLWAQCDLGMQNKVKSHVRWWKNAVKKSDAIKLLEIIDKICSSAGNQSNKYGAYKQSLYNNYCQGDGQYLKSVADACTMLDNYKFNPKLYNVKPTPAVGHTFYLSRGKKEKNEESEGSESDSSQDDNGVQNRYRNLTCYQCGQKRHIATICKAVEHIDGTTIATNHKKGNSTKEEEQQTGAMMHIDQSDSEGDDNDTESDMEDYLDDDDYNYQIGWTNCIQGITKDRKEVVVEDVRRNKKHATEELHLYTNAGMRIITHMGDLPGFESVWFHSEGIANVLSFDGVAKTKGYMIKYNNLTMGNYFCVTDPSGEMKIFCPSRKGLYYWDSQHLFAGSTRMTMGTMSAMVKTTPSMFNEGTVLVETICENKQNISKRDIWRAEMAHALQHIAGHLSDAQLLKICQKPQLVNIPVTPRDVQLMRAILGPSIPGLKGKAVRHKKETVEPNMIPIPQHIWDHYMEITMGIDTMYINGVPFLTTISRHRSFRITTILLADGQFKPLTMSLAGKHIKLNILVSRDKHVPEAKRYNRTSSASSQAGSYPEHQVTTPFSLCQSKPSNALSASLTPLAQAYTSVASIKSPMQAAMTMMTVRILPPLMKNTILIPVTMMMTLLTTPPRLQE